MPQWELPPAAGLFSFTCTRFASAKCASTAPCSRMVVAADVKARSQLRAAVLTKDTSKLQHAISACMAAGYRGLEFDHAAALLATLQRKSVAQQRNTDCAFDVSRQKQAMVEERTLWTYPTDMRETRQTSCSMQASTQATDIREEQAMKAEAWDIERINKQEECSRGSCTVVAQKKNEEVDPRYEAMVKETMKNHTNAAARSRLTAAVSCQEMEDAISFGQAAGLSEQEVEDAIKILQVLRQLEYAISCGTSQDLGTAISAAQCMDFKPKLCIRAEGMLESQKRREAARLGIEAAMSSHDMEDAICFARGARLSENELQDATEILQTLKQLEDAIFRGSSQDLAVAIESAQHRNLSPELRRRAERLLESKKREAEELERLQSGHTSSEMEQQWNKPERWEHRLLVVIKHYFDRDGDGHVTIEELLTSEVTGDKAQEDLMMQHVPFFIMLQVVLSTGLWAVFAIKNHDFKGIQGLDNFFKGRTLMKVHDDCNDHRAEVWRWFTYQYSHHGLRHIMLNSVICLLLGVPLEGFQGFFRVALIFNIGVLSGAMGIVVISPHKTVSGMSGGGYALMGMHVADLLINYSEKRYRRLTILMVIAVAVLDISLIAANFGEDTVSYSAHFGGLMGGIFGGILLQRNLRVTKCERALQLITMFVVVGVIAFCCVWYNHWPPRGILDDTRWCWVRQVSNKTLFGNPMFVCVQCYSSACIQRWDQQEWKSRVNFNECDKSKAWAYKEP